MNRPIYLENLDDKMYSFIIPHHNTPRLLDRLIESIPQRTDIEIIVVDDNSDDDKKANVSRDGVKTIYLDKEDTKGAGKARNVGIAEAKGKWLLFADSDDFYKPGVIDVLDEYCNQDLDIVFFNIDSVDSYTLQPDKQNRALQQQKMIFQFDGSEESKNRLLYFGGAPWRKMLSTKYVKKYGFQFEETSIHNDVFFSLQTSHFAKQIAVDKRILYTLTFCEGSITYSKMTKQKIFDNLLFLKKTANFYNYIGHPEWNIKSYRGWFSQSVAKHIYSLIRERRYELAFQNISVLISNMRKIHCMSNYYVERTKELERKT